MSNDSNWLHKFVTNILKNVRSFHAASMMLHHTLFICISGWVTLLFIKVTSWNKVTFKKSNFSNLNLLENKQIESSKCFTKRINDEANIGIMKQIADIIQKFPNTKSIYCLRLGNFMYNIANLFHATNVCFTIYSFCKTLRWLDLFVL